MSKGGKKHFGKGTQGKHSGTGARTVLPPDKVEENMILSNRDKSQHPEGRGQDSKWIQSEQRQDNSANRLVEED